MYSVSLKGGGIGFRDSGIGHYFFRESGISRFLPRESGIEKSSDIRDFLDFFPGFRDFSTILPRIRDLEMFRYPWYHYLYSGNPGNGQSILIFILELHRKAAVSPVNATTALLRWRIEAFTDRLHGLYGICQCASYKIIIINTRWFWDNA